MNFKPQIKNYKTQKNSTIDDDGFTVLAGPYKEDEIEQMNSVISHLDHGGIRHVIKETPEGMEVWRDRKGFVLAWELRNQREGEYKRS